MSRPYYPYPDEDDFELKEKEHFGWYDSQSAVLKELSTSAPFHEFRPLSFHFGLSEQFNVSGDASTTPPNGGRQAWLHALAGFLVVFNAQGLNMAFGVFQAYYDKVLLPTTASSKIAWIGSIQIFFLFFMALLVSPAVHHGHFRVCFSGGSVMLCLSIFATSYCTSWWQFFAIQGLLTGMAMGTVFASGLVVLISYFTTHLNVATGIAATGGPVGGIVFPLIARAAVTGIGFGWTVRLFALINMLTMGIANLIVRERRMPQKGECVSHTELHAPQPVRNDVPYLCMTLGMFSTYLGFFVAYYYIVLYGQDVIGLTDDTAINLLVAMNAFNLLGRIIPAFISDVCLGPLNTLVPWTMVSSIFALLWISAVNSTGVFLIACCYGFASAAIQGLYTSTIVNFVGRSGPVAAQKMGLVLAAIGVAVLIGSPIAGALIARSNGDYLHAQLFAGITLLAGGLFLVLARYLKCGWRPERI